MTGAIEPAIDGILDFNARAEKYTKYIKNINKKRFTTGMGPLDSVIRGVSPGEAMTIIAYSGTYKTALLQNLLAQGGLRTGLQHMFFSMEMPVESVFEREMQMSNHISGHQVEYIFKNRDAALEEYLKSSLMNGSSYLLVCDKNRLTLKDIERYICAAYAKYGDLGCVGVDYLGLVKSEGKTLLDRVAEVSFGIKDMAKKLNLPIIMLCQVSRGYATSKEAGIETDAAKGGGDIEAGCDYMLGMFNQNNQLYMRVLKNRKGRSGMYFEVDLDAESMKFNGLTPCDPPQPTKKAKDCPY